MTASLLAQPVESLYVHVPFCVRKCRYCAFYSEPLSAADDVDHFISALERELELVAADLKPRTIYFGGGTPTILAPHQWQRLANTMMRLNLLGAIEWTVECNPATFSLEKARLLRSLGVTRASLGVQSLDDRLLAQLGRAHTQAQAVKAFETLRKAGFDNINLDLIFGIPGQSIGTWRRTLAEALAMQSEHLSCYELTYEEDTPLFKQLGAKKSDAAEELTCAMYDELLERAVNAGFYQYEVSNFARDICRSRPIAHSTQADPTAVGAAVGQQPDEFIPAYACRHNINYWRGGWFCGLGPSAASYVQGVRTRNYGNTQLYCALLGKGMRPIEFSEQLSLIARAGEIAAFGLRMVAGWSFDEFRRITGFDLQTNWRSELERLTESGWGMLTQNGFRLTRQGLRFADAAAELFLR